MAANLRLVGKPIDLRTIAALERLLALAKTGDLTGLAYIALHPSLGPGNGYSADTLGAICDNCILARGICRELEDLVTK